MRAIIVLGLSIVLAALPAAVRAQDRARVSTVALAGTRLKHEPSHADVRAHKASREQNRASRHGAKSATRGKAERAKLRKGGAAPKFTFEQRVARSFDPLSLTLAPDTHLDRSSTQFRPLDGAAADDRGQAAIPPSDPTTDRITSAGIENMEKGNNHTFVVPLFQLLNKLSSQPPPPPQ